MRIQHMIGTPAGWMRLGGGIAFTFAIAFAGLNLSELPGFARAGALACSILIAVAYRQFAGYPEALRPGVQFASRKLLRYAIVLFGLKLNMDVVLHQGLVLLARDVVVIGFSIAATCLLARWLKADRSLSLLLGIGTGVCGAAAIAAVSPIVKAKEEDTAIGAGLVALVGTLFAIGYTSVRPLLPLTPSEYGVWSGTSLHEIAHVALAGAPAGNDGLAIALLAKLGRVFLLVPLSLLLHGWMKRRARSVPSAAEADGNAAIAFPWFLIGFIAMSVLGSYVLGSRIAVPQRFLDEISFLTSFMLSMAMIGLGLNVSLREVRNKAMRPLLVMTIVSVMLSGLAYLMV